MEPQKLVLLFEALLRDKVYHQVIEGYLHTVLNISELLVPLLSVQTRTACLQKLLWKNKMKQSRDLHISCGSKQRLLVCSVLSCFTWAWNIYMSLHTKAKTNTEIMLHEKNSISIKLTCSLYLCILKRTVLSTTTLTTCSSY